jgi:hypothetical protein
VAGKLASPAPLQLCSSLSAQSSCLSLHDTEHTFMLCGTRLFFNRLMYFMLPVSVYILLKINDRAFYAF